MTKLTGFLLLAILGTTAISAPVRGAATTAFEAQAAVNRAMQPHRILARAYRDSLSTFARTLQRPPNWTAPVDPIMTVAAVVEMRRSFDLMKQLYQVHMSYDRDARITLEQQGINTILESIGYNLEELERQVSYNALHERRISEMTDRILQECARLT